MAVEELGVAEPRAGFGEGGGEGEVQHSMEGDLGILGMLREHPMANPCCGLWVNPSKPGWWREDAPKFTSGMR